MAKVIKTILKISVVTALIIVGFPVVGYLSDFLSLPFLQVEGLYFVALFLLPLPLIIRSKVSPAAKAVLLLYFIPVALTAILITFPSLFNPVAQTLFSFTAVVCGVLLMVYVLRVTKQSGPTKKTAAVTLNVLLYWFVITALFAVLFFKPICC